MSAEQVNTLGGLCELVGLGFVARDLMAPARYQGRLAQLVAWFRARKARLVTVARKLLGRPGRSVDAHAGAATGMAVTATNATVRTMRGPFTPRQGQSLREQVEELGLLVNRLREEVIREPQERGRAIAAEREARRAELRAEVERLERLVAELGREVERLRDATAGELRVRAEGVVFLVVGIFLTVWPKWFADWLLGWLSLPTAVFFVFAYLVTFPSVKWLRSRQDQPPSPRVGCGVLWHGPNR